MKGIQPLPLAFAPAAAAASVASRSGHIAPQPVKDPSAQKDGALQLSDTFPPVPDFTFARQDNRKTTK